MHAPEAHEAPLNEERRRSQSSPRESVGHWVGILCLMAVLALWGLGALVEARVGRPLLTPVTRSWRTALEPLAALQTGLDDRLAHASRALKRNRTSTAAVALDAARRIARLGGESVGAPFDVALAHVMDARTALQNGRPEAAVPAVQAARNAVESAHTHTPSPAQARTMHPEEHYRGSIVINAQGVRIGKVERILGDTIWILLGGQHDLLGFLDLPEEAVAIPVAEVLLGSQEGAQPILVMLPLFTTDTSAILAVTEEPVPPGP